MIRNIVFYKEMASKLISNKKSLKVSQLDLVMVWYCK